ncbi:acyl-CoA dehydrogenase [Streptomyces pilosus]|uniref:acyl-CoA dehydrogenase family protein n=1 Tax=Streptomyces pilosus TaxID=28893 RepID=UPI0019BE7775|nr:acyl-CoA dehydrogenase family protein [Streptomyces pilosus]GGV46158.1 acyl-CoA dehydrogenase [Streptomyces pilosus]
MTPTALMRQTPETPTLRQLRREVRGFLQEEMATGSFTPRPDSWQSATDPAFSRRLAARGWVGMTLPPEYGGQGRSSLERYVVTEELLAHGAPVAAHWIADRQMGPSILKNGTERQRRHYLPAIARAEKFFAIGMSEPDAGSDLASVRTKAVSDGDGWRISGTKVWTSVAHISHAMVVLARTDPGERHTGLSQFIVDLPNPGVTIRPIITVDGAHHFNEVVFDEAHVDDSALLGTRGEGWAQVTAELAYERSGPERILSTYPVLHAWARTLGPQDTAEQLELGRLTARLSVLRQLSLGVAAQLAKGGAPAREAALVKDLGTAFESEVTETIRRFAKVRPGDASAPLGGLLAEAVLHAPAFTLRGGTSEVLRSIVAKGL